MEMQLTQQSNTTATGNKTYHLVISFAPGEEPSEAVLRAVEHEVAKSMGYQEHQRVAVVHHDTDCLHIQVAINKVHPDTLRCVTPKNDYRKRQEACARLEKQSGFVVGSGIKDGRDAGRDLAKGMEKFSGNQSLTN